MSDKGEKINKNQDVYELCKCLFKSDNDKNKHHDHHLRYNNYVDACCTRCNLQIRDKSRRLVFVAHNVSYDLGFILKEMKQDLPIDVSCEHSLNVFKNNLYIY